MIYLDNSSTTRQADEVTETMYEIARDDFGNPSSLHILGLNAEKKVEAAREAFAGLLGVDPSKCYFNSGGTEGDNEILLEAAKKRKHDGKRIVISAVEHPAIMETVERLTRDGFEVVKIGTGPDGKIGLDELRSAVASDTILVSLMTVNNETGAIMPVIEASEIAHDAGAWFHTDAVQAFGKLDMREISKTADFITVSSHKIHGPKGVGAVYSAVSGMPPFITGGGQEKGRRSGTENVPGISGFGKACELAEAAGVGFAPASGDAAANAFDHVKKLRDALRKGIEDNIPDIIVNSPDDALPYVLNITFLGTRGEVLLHTLEQDEIYVSTGSACSSNKNGKSYVLAALGRSDKEIEGALRFSLSRYNTMEEIEIAVDKVKEAVERFRLLGSFR